jgi:hypothetical protein
MDKVPDDTRELIDKRRHAFTIERLELVPDAFVWTCACGEHFIQLDGEDIRERLIDHAKGLS